MTRRPINRSPLIPQQQALVEQQAGREDGHAEVIAAVTDLLGDHVDPTVVDALEDLNTQFEAS